MEYYIVIFFLRKMRLETVQNIKSERQHDIHGGGNLTRILKRPYIQRGRSNSDQRGHVQWFNFYNFPKSISKKSQNISNLTL